MKIIRYNIVILFIMILSAVLWAQDNQQVQPAAVVTGYVTSEYKTIAGKGIFLPSFHPILLAPIGENFLLEAEIELEGTIHRQSGEFVQEWEKKMEYLQIDYFPNDYLTIVAGGFLTPFGIFNERLHPSWIKNIQETPFVHMLVPETQLGGMGRVGVNVAKNFNLNYSAYYSFQPAPEFWIEAQRGLGGRVGAFLPIAGLELGASFHRFLVGEETNLWGVDLTYQHRGFPLELRGEYVNGHEGKTYWAELAYRLRDFPIFPDFMENNQIVARFEQFFAPEELMEEAVDSSQAMEEALPAHEEALLAHDTNRLIVGWNYYIVDGLKVSLTYGKTFEGEDATLFSISFSFRPVF